MKARAYLLIARSCRSLLIRVVQGAGTESELFHSAPLPSRSGISCFTLRPCPRGRALLRPPAGASQDRGLSLTAHGRLYAMAETLRSVWLAVGGDEQRQHRVGQCPAPPKGSRPQSRSGTSPGRCRSNDLVRRQRRLRGDRLKTATAAGWPDHARRWSRCFAHPLGGLDLSSPLSSIASRWQHREGDAAPGPASHAGPMRFRPGGTSHQTGVHLDARRE